MSLNIVKVGFHDKVPGLWAFEAQMPFQKYQRPPIVFRWCLKDLIILGKLMLSKSVLVKNKITWMYSLGLVFISFRSISMVHRKKLSDKSLETVRNFSSSSSFHIISLASSKTFWMVPISLSLFSIDIQRITDTLRQLNSTRIPNT